MPRLPEEIFKDVIDGLKRRALQDSIAVSAVRATGHFIEAEHRQRLADRALELLMEAEGTFWSAFWAEYPDGIVKR